MTEQTIFPFYLWPTYVENLSKMDVFDQQDELKNMLRNDTENPNSGYRFEAEQKAVLRQKGILTYPSELAVRKGTHTTNLTRYTRRGTGEPIINPKGPEPVEVLLPQNGMEPHAEVVFRHAYYKDMSLIKKELDTILVENQSGLRLSDIDKTVADTWRLVSPAFRHMGLHPSREIDSKKDIASQHRELLTKYIYAKNIYKFHAPISEKGGEGSGQIPFMPWPATDALAKRGMFAPPSSSEWDMTPEGIISDLYGGTNWLINLPGFPGQKRFVPKNLPFSFASQMDDSEMEFWVKTFQDLAGDFKSYRDKTIYEDKDSNISVYVDVSKTGEGMSFFFRERGQVEGTEKLDSLISWTEFGEFIAMRASYNMLADMKKWFRGNDDFLANVPFIKELDVVKWFQKSRTEKALDILKSTEDKLENDPNSYRMQRSLQTSAFIDDTNIWRLNLNKLGERPQSEDVNFSELQRWWIMGLESLSVPEGFGLSASSWRDEFNWAQAMFGGKGEIGHLGKQAMVNFLIEVNNQFPDLNKMTEDDFDRIINEEMQKYVLTEISWWDDLSSGASDFGVWAKSRMNLLRDQSYQRTGTPVRPNPNR